MLPLPPLPLPLIGEGLIRVKYSFMLFVSRGLVHNEGDFDGRRPVTEVVLKVKYSFTLFVSNISYPTKEILAVDDPNPNSG